MNFFVVFFQLISGRIWKVAAASFTGALIPLPGLSITVDLMLLKSESDLYKSQLGLPEEKSDEFRRIMTPELREKLQKLCMTTTAQIAELMSGYAASSVIEEATRFIPILGSVIAGSISYSSTYYFLQRYLNELESAALQFMDELNTRVGEDMPLD